jgi:hypothetical protein
MSLKKSLIKFGIIKPKVKGLTKLTYPKGALKKCQSLADQIADLIIEYSPDKIVVEEVNLGKNRLGQKVLDGAHFILLDRIEQHIPIIAFIDSDGNTGWRSIACLNLKLSKNDKTTNARRRKRNLETRKIAKKAKKRVTPGTILPIISKKHKAAEVVNRVFYTDFDVDLRKSDADIADSIGLGLAYMVFVLNLYEL